VGCSEVGCSEVGCSDFELERSSVLLQAESATATTQQIASNQ